MNSEQNDRLPHEGEASDAQMMRTEEQLQPSLEASSPPHLADSRRTTLNFVCMSILFSANHGSVVSCLSVATPRLGETGAWQSGILYLTYTVSAVLGATWIVKQLGGRDGMILGMLLYCAYVGCFWLITLADAPERLLAYTGAAIGGVGAGFLWTAQGSYFTKAAEEHALINSQDVSLSTAHYASVFAFIYLALEVVFKGMSSFLLGVLNVSWSTIFALYAVLTVTSTALMVFIHKYPNENSSNDTVSGWLKLTAAWQLLRSDPKMPLMIGLNSTFGFASSFLNSYVNSEAARVVFNDPNSHSIGYLAAWVSIVAAVASLAFDKISQRVGNGPILTLGSVCFAFVAIPFLLVPDLSKWNSFFLVSIYSLHGLGRATFEGTLKATFADYFAYEKEGAFANIILQNGLSSSIGYFLTFGLKCSQPSSHCSPYHDGTYHDTFTFEAIIVISAVLGTVGFWRAHGLHAQTESDNLHEDTADLLEENLVTDD